MSSRNKLLKQAIEFKKRAHQMLSEKIEPHLNLRIQEGVGIGVDEYLALEEAGLAPEVLKKAQMGVVIWVLDQMADEKNEAWVERELKKLVRSNFPMELLAKYLN